MSISLRECPLLYDIRGSSLKMSLSNGCCVMKCQLFIMFVMLSSNVLEELVLSSQRASPLMKLLFTPDRWQV